MTKNESAHALAEEAAEPCMTMDLNSQVRLEIICLIQEVFDKDQFCLPPCLTLFSIHFCPQWNKETCARGDHSHALCSSTCDSQSVVKWSR